jgi:hypothetical protein
METEMKNDSKPQPQTQKPQLIDLNPIDLQSVTGGQQVDSLDMVQSASRTCFCAKTGNC